ncbi:ropporin-1-like protein [Selaginella moellendorffii]|uniref:ropporin-1-like protein n=1 Tax=Selaginella moellendorffii TaxID=88036 RepID=UPI000D1C7264|nr:ropporin-1-like protein [Selaginella moellendorffii]|eukprot:XP_024529591.1 ropporin-1-like protein [Selaginella moellendorffii]
MDLDYDPIYCVEQIQIPPALPDILKGFAKEAIRSQPPCLHEFACTYFQRLLATAKLDATAPPPTLAQLQAVWVDLKDTESMNPETLREICASHGIASAAFSKVFQLIEFPSDPVDPKEILVLLVTTTAKSFVAVIDALFKVFGHKTGGKMSVPLFFKILFFMAKRDRDISPQTVSDLTKSLADKDWVSFGDVRSSPHMQHYFNTKP